MVDFLTSFPEENTKLDMPDALPKGGTLGSEKLTSNGNGIGATEPDDPNATWARGGGDGYDSFNGG